MYTTDPDKTEHFYVHDLGAMKGTDPQNPLGVRYYFNPVQFVEVLPLPQGWTSVSRFDHAGYNTEDAEALRRYLGAHSVTVPAAVTKGSDGSLYFVVKDPEENRIQFVQPPAHPPVGAGQPAEQAHDPRGLHHPQRRRRGRVLQDAARLQALLAWRQDGRFL